MSIKQFIEIESVESDAFKRLSKPKQYRCNKAIKSKKNLHDMLNYAKQLARNLQSYQDEYKRDIDVYHEIGLYVISGAEYFLSGNQLDFYNSFKQKFEKYMYHGEITIEMDRSSHAIKAYVINYFKQRFGITAIISTIDDKTFLTINPPKYDFHK